MFEPRTEPLLTRRAFAVRLLAAAGAALVLVILSLSIGAVGYHATEDLAWLNAYHHAAMILTGMGPVTAMKTDGGKWFEIVYAIFSGVVFLTVAALLLGPIAHRILHRFHLEATDDDQR